MGVEREMSQQIRDIEDQIRIQSIGVSGKRGQKKTGGNDQRNNTGKFLRGGGYRPERWLK